MIHLENRENPNIRKGNVGERESGSQRGGSQMGGRAGGQPAGTEAWTKFRSKVRSKWSDIEERDLDRYKGRNREELSGFINQRVSGSRREDINRDLDSISRETGYRFQE